MPCCASARRSDFGRRILYNRTLVDRLYRANMPSVVVWGAEDHMVPVAHGKAYAKNLGGATLN